MSTRITAADFRDEGYLVEVNRRVLHPLGLALAVDVAADTITVLDDRLDPEGCRYAYGTDQPPSLDPDKAAELDADLRSKVRRVANLEQERRPVRVAALGYFVQPITTEP